MTTYVATPIQEGCLLVLFRNQGKWIRPFDFLNSLYKDKVLVEDDRGISALEERIDESLLTLCCNNEHIHRRQIEIDEEPDEDDLFHFEYEYCYLPK